MIETSMKTLVKNIKERGIFGTDLWVRLPSIPLKYYT